jgi:predicted CXXCH cytochrome family protein
MQEIQINIKGAITMNKLLTIMFFMALSIAVMYGMADAISGQCSNCHTMHASQDGGLNDPAGNPMSGPNDLLLIGSGCPGCHTQNGLPSAPQVDKTTNLLAGGSYDTTTIATTDAKRHNVLDLGDSDTIDTPGNGGDSIMILDAPGQLTCAGAKGCHGKHVPGMDSDAGIKGSHHAAAGTTYRFLWIGVTDSPVAVLGEGVSDYEETVSDTSHNVYSAHATQGISSFCNQCHGEFHGETETGGPDSPWTRHPTDVALFTAGGAGWDSTLVDIHANDAPIGLIAIEAGVQTTTNNYYTGGTIDTTDTAVMCLSCHRAHGTVNDDLLRWDYSTILAGGTRDECLSCHYLQSDTPN